MGNSQIYGVLMLCLGALLATAILFILTVWLAWTSHYVWASVCGVVSAAFARYVVRAWRGR